MATQIAAQIVAEEADLLMLPPAVSPENYRDPQELRRNISDYLHNIPAKQRILGISALVFLGVATLLLLIFHNAIFGWIQPFCESWRYVLPLNLAAL